MGGSIMAEARSVTSPWTSDLSFQDLVYGASSTVDVQRIMGEPPDEIVKTAQMFPVIENYYYYENGGTGAATVFVFENGLLVGLHYKSPQNQYMDLTSFLMNNGDRLLNSPMLGGFRGYFPLFPLYSPFEN